MFDDPKFGNLFPTRTGTASGTANERQMLDTLGGADGFRTRVQRNADGSETTLRTKDGMPQFSTTTTSQTATEPLVWTYDFNAVKKVGENYVPDALVLPQITAPMWDSGKGLKTRRAGLVKLDNGKYALTVSESGYDAYNTPNIMRGPNYWYNSSDVVTWTIDTWLPTAPDDYGQRLIGVVQHEKSNFEVVPMSSPDNRFSPIIVAACVVSKKPNPDHVRVATVVGGTTQRLVITDYLNGVEQAVCKLDFPFVVSSFSVAPIGVKTDYFSFSSDGLSLLIGVNSTLGSFPSTNTCKALVVSITTGAVINGISLYSFPVNTPDNSYTTSTWVTSSSGGDDYSQTGLVPEQIVGWINQTTGEWVFYNTPERTTGGAYGKTPYNSSLKRPGSETHEDRAYVLRVGFDANNTPCAVISRYRSIRTAGGELTIDYKTEDTIFSNPQIHQVWAGKSIVNYCTSSSYSYADTITVTASAYVSYKQTVYVCKGNSVIFETTTSCSKSRGGAGNSEERHFNASSYSLTPGPLGNVTEKTVVSSGGYTKGGSTSNAPGRYNYDIACVAADFFSGVIVIAETNQFFTNGYSDVRDYSKDTTGKTIYDITTRVYDQNPSGYTVEYKVIDNGSLKASYQITKTAPGLITGLETPKAFVGTADYRAKDKTLLILHADDDTTTFGLHYKDGVWTEVVPNPSEPNPQYAHPVRVSKLSHY